MKLNPHLTSYTKINSRWSIDINARAKTVSAFREKIHNLGLDEEFLESTPKAFLIDKSNLIKI